MSRFLQRTDTLLLSLGLAMLLLLLASWDLQRAFGPEYSGRVVSAITEQVRASPETMSRIYAFAIKVFLFYVAFGLLVWASARATIALSGALQAHRLLVVLAWFLVLSLTIGFVNADLYPSSRAGLWSRSVNGFLAPGFPLWKITAPLVVLAWASLIVLAIRRAGWTRPALRVAAWGLVGAATLLTVNWARLARNSVDEQPPARADAGAPNVILIGIDSLRPTLVGDREQLGYLPALSEFTQAGHRFVDATTPLARTFPSWMAMLSGRRPASTGIRENLMPREIVDPAQTLPHLLAEHGYQTIYATDEVRFSNIDGSYGFESTLIPRIGASDFLLGRANDFPLTNLFANTIVAEKLFPETFANRAAANTYDPSSFVARLKRGIRVDQRPVFLAIHLTLPHWPYRWREQDVAFADVFDSAYAYLAAVIEADRQFSQVLQVLKEKRLLDHALVVAFSDHGEGLSRPSDTLVQPGPGQARPRDLPNWVWGHGTSVLSAPQFQVFLAARTFGMPDFSERPGVHRDAVSIEDIAPTVLDVAGIPGAARGFDGISLAGALQGRDADVPADRVRFTESAYSTPSLRQGAADEASLIEEGSDVFRVNATSGWVEIRTELWDELLAVRERAAIGATQILAAVPTEVPDASSYFLVPRSGGPATRLTGPPPAGMGAEASSLWSALFAEYGDELGKPTGSTQESQLASATQPEDLPASASANP